MYSFNTTKFPAPLPDQGIILNSIALFIYKEKFQFTHTTHKIKEDKAQIRLYLNIYVSLICITSILFMTIILVFFYTEAICS